MVFMAMTETATDMHWWRKTIIFGSTQKKLSVHDWNVREKCNGVTELRAEGRDRVWVKMEIRDENCKKSERWSSAQSRAKKGAAL